jgi:hypothetical protein
MMCIVFFLSSRYNLSTKTTLRATPGGHGSDATSASALEVKPRKLPLDLECTRSRSVVGMHDYTIDEAAERTGLSKHTLRYYEREGLLPPIAKASSGHRRYTDDDIGWVRFLQLLRATGMPIREAKVCWLLGMPRPRMSPANAPPRAEDRRCAQAEMSEGMPSSSAS